jgi:hypothetical protein
MMTSISSSRAVRITMTAVNCALTQLPAHRDPVEIGKPEIQQHQIEGFRQRGSGGTVPGRLPPHLMAVRGQARPERMSDRLVVLDQEKPRHAIVLRAPPPPPARVVLHGSGYRTGLAMIIRHGEKPSGSTPGIDAG